MKRLEMLRKAKELAYEQIDFNSCLSDVDYEALNKVPDEEAIKELAGYFLKDAVEYGFGD